MSISERCYDLKEITNAIKFLHPDRRFALCAIDTNGNATWSDFGSHEKAGAIHVAAEVSEYGGAKAVYITLNEVVASHPSEHGVLDDDIVRRWNILIDLDVPELKNKAGERSATEAEKKPVRAAAAACSKYLRHEHGFPAMLMLDSGNGVQLIIRTDLPNDEASRTLVQQFLRVLERRFASSKVKFDPVFNAARLCKLAGTMTRKGGNTADRPHRLARILELPKGEPAPVTAAMLQAVIRANPLPKAKASPSAPAKAAPISASDEEQLALARRSKSSAKFIALYDQGAWEAAYSSHSEADFALCAILRYWLGADPARIDAAFRRSALYRTKWNRTDYRQRTIARALPGKVYDSSADHSALRRQIKLAIEALPKMTWPGRTGPSNLHLAEAFHRIAYLTGSLDFTASYRQLAEHAGLSLLTTWKAAQRLIKAGIIKLLKRRRRDTAHWRLILKPDDCRNYNNRLSQEKGSVTIYCYKLRTSPSHDAWHPRAIGKGCRQIWMLLKPDDGVSVSLLAEQLSLSSRTITARLRKLRDYGLAQCSDERLWYLVESDLDKLAQRMGTDGTAVRRKLWHEAERQAYQQARFDYDDNELARHMWQIKEFKRVWPAIMRDEPYKFHPYPGRKLVTIDQSTGEVIELP